MAGAESLVSSALEQDDLDLVRRTTELPATAPLPAGCRSATARGPTLAPPVACVTSCCRPTTCRKRRRSGPSSRRDHRRSAVVAGRRRCLQVVGLQQLV